MFVISLRKRLLHLRNCYQSDQEVERFGATSNYAAEFVNDNPIGTVKFVEINVFLGCLFQRPLSVSCVAGSTVYQVSRGCCCAFTLFTTNFAFVSYPFRLRMWSRTVPSDAFDWRTRTLFASLTYIQPASRIATNRKIHETQIQVGGHWKLLTE